MTDHPETSGRWFYVHEGRRKGPVSVAQLADLILAQDLPEESLVWRHGLDEWAPASSVDEIKRELPPPLPSPAPDKATARAEAVADAEGSARAPGTAGRARSPDRTAPTAARIGSGGGANATGSSAAALAG